MWMFTGALGLLAAGVTVAGMIKKESASGWVNSKKRRLRELDERLDEALRETFPSSDAVASY